MVNYRTNSLDVLMRRFFWVHLALAMALACALSPGLQAQSTYATVLGTVKEASGAVVPNAKVQLTNTGTNAARSTLTNASGGYEFVNIEVGTYTLEIQSPGFRKVQFSALTLQARESRRLDAQLDLATQSTTVNVESSAGAIIQTDTSNISESKGSRELTDLPVAIGSRASGSTSPMSTLTAQPGVQTDSSGGISVAGTLPTQLSVSIDGISSVGPATQGALTELFPSFNAIEEIRIGETINPAEYGGVADIATISKAGTNVIHGGLFENLQNTAFNAADTFSHETATIKMNNFGVYMGGPVVIPKLYNGRNKTFFFGSYEVLRLPRNTTAVESVPTAAMRSGDLSAYSDPITGYPGNIIPANKISAYAQDVLNAFYPLPNYGAPGAISNNYLASFDIPINSSQGDFRIDQTINSKNQVFARFTYKNRRVLKTPTDPNGLVGLPTQGTISQPEVDDALTIADNWVITPNIINEARFGFSGEHSAVTFGVTAIETAQLLNLTALPGPLPPGDVVPTINIAGFQGLSGLSYNNNEGTKQFLDSLTWTKGKHTMKFGFDYRYLNGLFTNVFAQQRVGTYVFNGSVMGALLGAGGVAGPSTALASFLLGYPDSSTVATVTNPNTNSYSQHFGYFAQDDFKVTRSLTINFGLRYEYHPSFHDHYNNLANFVPSINTSVNGVNVPGAIVIPGASTVPLVNPAFAESIAPTPIITAAQAGIPSALRFSQKTDLAPRFGFAWRPFNDDKTVVRGGYGRFIETLMTSAVYNGWAVEASDVAQFNNTILPNGTPQYTTPYAWPSNIALPGTQSFYLATNIHYKDPYVQEWNITFERDLGAGIGLRLSYDGNHSSALGMVGNLNQLHVNTTGFDPTLTPFPLFQYIAYQSNYGYGNYNAFTASVHKQMGNGLQFQSSYSFTKNLSNVTGVGSSPAATFAGEAGGTLTDPYNPSLDYGNVPYTRRQRSLTTFLYDLPFGRGRTFMSSANKFTNALVGGWELSGILLFQSGPFMSVTTYSDPSGTGYNIFNSNGGRADTVPGMNPYAGQTINQWINPNAFVDPTLASGGAPIGRFGNSGSGNVVGPGTNVVSASLIKTFNITESIHAQLGVQVSNLLNHPNYAPPTNLNVNGPAFGQITSMQSAENGGPRALQLAARVTF